MQEKVELVVSPRIEINKINLVQFNGMFVLILMVLSNASCFLSAVRFIPDCDFVIFSTIDVERKKEKKSRTLEKKNYISI
jgi:hypothetical protein